MPVATTDTVTVLRNDFRPAARVADMLGVSRSQVTRWMRGAGIEPVDAEKVDLLEMMGSNLLRIYASDAAGGVSPCRNPGPVCGGGRPRAVPRVRLSGVACGRCRPGQSARVAERVRRSETRSPS
jgi:hypothetical protein